MAYRDVILAEASLQSYWHLDEATGDAIDQESTINGTYGAGCERQVTGLIASSPAAKAVGLVGADADSVGFGNNYNFAGTASFTIELWFKPTLVPAAPKMIAHKRAGAPNADGWTIDYWNAGTRFRRIDSGAGADEVALGAMSQDSTYYIVATYDGSTMTLSLNAGTPGSIGSTRSITATTEHLRVGAHGTLGDGGTGTADEFAIYNAALSEAQQQAHYDAATDPLAKSGAGVIGP